MEHRDLLQKIEQLEQKVSALENQKQGIRKYFSTAFRKTNVIIGIVISVMIASAILFAAQITFTNGTVISATDVNANFTELYNSVLSAETFTGSIANSADIVSTNNGFVKFTATQNSDTSVFEPVVDGDYGIKIKKAGKIIYNLDQTITVGAGSLAAVLWAAIDSTQIAITSSSPTNGNIHGVHIGGVYPVAADQVLKFYWYSSTCDITALNDGLAGNVSIMWVGKK